MAVFSFRPVKVRALSSSSSSRIRVVLICMSMAYLYGHRQAGPELSSAEPLREVEVREDADVGVGIAPGVGGHHDSLDHHDSGWVRRSKLFPKLSPSGDKV